MGNSRAGDVCSDFYTRYISSTAGDKTFAGQTAKASECCFKMVTRDEKCKPDNKDEPDPKGR